MIDGMVIGANTPCETPMHTPRNDSNGISIIVLRDHGIPGHIGECFCSSICKCRMFAIMAPHTTK